VGYYPVSAVDASNFAYKTISTVADTILISSASGVVPKLACTLLNVNKMVSAVAFVPDLINSGVASVSAVSVSGVKVVGSVVATNGVITSGVQGWTQLSFSAVNNAGLDPTQTPVFPVSGYPAGSAVMHNLGPNPTLIRTTFAVNALAQFTKTLNGGTTDIVADNIVSLQAQYGIAPLGTQSINCWVNPTAANTNPASTNCPAGDVADWTPAGLVTTPNNIKRIKAIRVAIVARNSLREKATNGVCTTTVTAPISWLNGPAIDLTANPEWKCYRYKVYQTIIPLNNVILGNV
jgi:hypothetical protein